MRGRRNQHEWDYIGYSKEVGEIGYCNLCKKYRYTTKGSKGFTFITKKKVLELLNGEMK